VKSRIEPPLRIIKAVQLREIRLVEANCKTRIRSVQEAGDVEVRLDWSARLKEKEPDNSFVIAPSLDLQIVPKGAKEETLPLVWMRVGFEATYRLPDGLRATRRELRDFAQINGIFNVWPYWREFIQNMFARMNLPPFFLPVYRIEDHLSRQEGPEPAVERELAERESGPVPAE
jgi:preprotein translocase subunit SecB